jgi:hypothetical protein
VSSDFSFAIRQSGREDTRGPVTNRASLRQSLIVSCYFLFCLYSPIQALAGSMKLFVSLQLLDLGQLVDFLGRVVISSQGLYLYTDTGKRTHDTKHSSHEWDSNQRSRRPRERKQFMP